VYSDFLFFFGCVNRFLFLGGHPRTGRFCASLLELEAAQGGLASFVLQHVSLYSEINCIERPGLDPIVFFKYSLLSYFYSGNIRPNFCA